jgi:proton-dependent oligopeptide transporter, POT family
MSQKVKHPKGLYYLFFAEMWERFGYYLMIGIFWLYMTEEMKNGGMGFEKIQADDIYGTFIAFVFLTPFLGGLLADRVLGYRTSITIGGVLMGLGYIGLAIPGTLAFFISLVLIIIGNGFFKPNISTLLGNLYTDEPYRAKKDDGYNIFYMGINIGAFICNFVAAWLRLTYGWNWAFAAAGIGMFIGVIVFWAGMKHYRHADVLKPVQPEDTPMGKIVMLTILPAFVCGIAGWMIPGNVLGSDSTDAFLFGAIPVVFFYITLYTKASKEEKKPIAALLTIFAVSVAFWAVFKQNGTALTNWAEKYTDREMPAAIVPLAASLKQIDTLEIVKDSVLVTDDQFRPVKDADGKKVKEIGYPLYTKNLSPEEMPAENGNLFLIPTELYQSVNPGWVILLTPVLVAFFAFLRRRGKEPSTPTKIALGLVISALSTFVMVAAVYACNNGQEKSDAMWLIMSYGVITVGELCLSPMGLSLVSKLSPPRLTALMMGGWFLSTSIGNKLSGKLASLWDTYDNKANYFLVNFLLLAIAAATIFFMLKWLRTIFNQYSGK